MSTHSRSSRSSKATSYCKCDLSQDEDKLTSVSRTPSRTPSNHSTSTAQRSHTSHRSSRTRESHQTHSSKAPSLMSLAYPPIHEPSYESSLNHREIPAGCRVEQDHLGKSYVSSKQNKVAVRYPSGFFQESQAASPSVRKVETHRHMNDHQCHNDGIKYITILGPDMTPTMRIPVRDHRSLNVVTRDMKINN